MQTSDFTLINTSDDKESDDNGHSDDDDDDECDYTCCRWDLR